MANPTTNFGWVMPTSTDLVTDLPADFAVFGQAVDTSMADLKGGTTGQILAKATNTDMDFTWITNDQGDITAVNTTAPLAGGGTSGALTLSIAAATTSVVGAVQLSDSTSTTSSVLAATPTAVKSAYDLADGAIAKTTVTTAGDILYRNATVPTRLGIGTAGQVLQVNSGATAPEWATPAGGTISFTTWTPTLTNITVGNGTQVARYGTSGKFVIAQYRLTFGSTTSFGGNIRFTLPIAPAYGGFQVFGAIADDGNATYFCAAEADPTTSTVYPNVLKADSTYLSNNSIGPTTPMTWGTGDKINIIFTYESV